MTRFENLTEQQLTRTLSYAGFILLSYELVKRLLVSPIKAFYWNTTFGDDSYFKSYEEDVLTRHKTEFEACLLYLRDFMKALNSDDVLTIQGLREHRNKIAHELPDLLEIDLTQYRGLLEKVDIALFKLSNYRTIMEIGADPEFQDVGIDWNTTYGLEYMMFKEIVSKVKAIQGEMDCGF
ncbi:MAG: hypothetical protein NUW37_11055 [Planctomycetes bacterium]|nr:hypothetical protein [Planctomycetota bacterium]